MSDSIAQAHTGVSLSQSIQTSDVFGTSFKRESSLVAAALEKECKKGNSDVPPRVIYGRLYKIRQMAFEQRFDIER